MHATHLLHHVSRLWPFTVLGACLSDTAEVCVMVYMKRAGLCRKPVGPKLRQKKEALKLMQQQRAPAGTSSQHWHPSAALLRWYPHM